LRDTLHRQAEWQASARNVGYRNLAGRGTVLKIGELLMVSAEPSPVGTEQEQQRESAAFLIDQSLGFVFPAALRAAAEIRVADHLTAGPRTAGQLAAETGTDPRNLYRVLRLLATRGIVEEDDAGRFTLAPAGAALCSDAPHSARSAILMLTDRTMWQPVGELARCLPGGATAFEPIFGMPFFDYFAQHAATGALFHTGMAAVSDPENQPIADTYDFPATGVVADVGGGRGGLLHAVLRNRPGLRGVLFDQAHVLAGHCPGDADTREIAGRWDTLPGDFFVSVPPADIYLLKRILHDWDDEQCVLLLGNCRAAMNAGARILVIDAVIPAGNEPHQAKTLDLMLMACLVGRERTREDFAGLCTAAGLRLTRVLPTPTVLCVVEAVAA
jgi:O-methyltransferase domain